jgi:hypothetical protein
MLNRDPAERVSAFECLKDMWFYPLPSHFRQHVGSMACIPDEDCEEVEMEERKCESSRNFKCLKSVSREDFQSF